MCGDADWRQQYSLTVIDASCKNFGLAIPFDVRRDISPRQILSTRRNLNLTKPSSASIAALRDTEIAPSAHPKSLRPQAWRLCRLIPSGCVARDTIYLAGTHSRVRCYLCGRLRVTTLAVRRGCEWVSESAPPLSVAVLRQRLHQATQVADCALQRRRPCPSGGHNRLLKVVLTNIQRHPKRQSFPRGGGCTSTPLESCSGPASGCSAGTRPRNRLASLEPRGAVRRSSQW